MSYGNCYSHCKAIVTLILNKEDPPQLPFDGEADCFLYAQEEVAYEALCHLRHLFKDHSDGAKILECTEVRFAQYRKDTNHKLKKIFELQDELRKIKGKPSLSKYEEDVKSTRVVKRLRIGVFSLKVKPGKDESVEKPPSPKEH
uniref:Uncharacterized protein n=1 Tax=Oryza punctata TaxID=4537 RepID=A0A0E0KN31_ORYPU